LKDGEILEKKELLESIAKRGNGSIYLGVVGAVRTGKSTFIKRFIENLVVPSITDEYEKKHCLDEIPQSAAGKTIMTTEPKFVPSNGADVQVGEFKTNIKLVDCVGFVIPGSSGYEDNEGNPRMVKTPWYEEPIPFIEAAEIGTEKVIKDHATIGIVVTSDGSFGDIPRTSYLDAEAKVIGELKEIGKPFIVILNSIHPTNTETVRCAKDLEDTSYFTITDSPALAYHQALHSPSYLSELTAMSIYMDNEKKYDIGAYFRKDFKKAEENIIQLCRELELSNDEATVVLESFVQEWRRLNITTSTPVIAFIKRKSVDHHYLKDYRKILEMCDKEDLSYLIGQLMESRIDDEKRYTPIDNEQVKIVTLPGWSQIYCDTGDFIEEKEEQVEPVAEKMPERVTVRNEVVNTYGNASIVALFGVLLIALGATITILLAIYKG